MRFAHTVGMEDSISSCAYSFSLSNPHHPMKVSRIAVRVACVCPLIGAISAAYSLSAAPAESSIDAVTVYPDAAWVSRVMDVEVVPGLQTVEMERLSSAIQDASLQAEVLAAPGLTLIRDIRFERETDRPESDAVNELRDQIRGIQEQVQALDEEAALMRRQMSYAEEMAKSFSSGYGTRETRVPTMEEARATWTYLHETAVAAQDGMRKIDEKRRLLKEETMELEKRLNELLDSDRQLQGKAILTLETDTEGLAKLRVRYLVSRAWWKPLYEVRSYPEKAEVEIAYLAEIQQVSGEEWKDVELTLSTSRSVRSGDVPELQPIRLNKLEPIDYAPRAMKATLSRNYAAMEDSAMIAQSAPMAPEATVEQGFSSFEIKAPHRVSILSVNQSTRTPLQRRTAKADLWTEVVASITQDAYLRASLIQNLDMPIIPGRGLLFVDDKLVGQTSLGRVLPGEEIKLSLGVDEAVMVTRKDGRSKESQSGLIDKTTTQMRQYMTTIKNARRFDHRILFKDQFPISENEKIVVRRLAPSEKDVVLDATTGIFEINRVFTAGQEQSYETRFEVVYPRDWEIPMSF